MRSLRSVLALALLAAVAGCVTINNQPPGDDGPPEPGPKAGPQQEEKGPFEPWEEVLEDTREIEGFFEVHEKRDKTVFLELPPERLGEDFGLVLHYSQGVGDVGIQEGLPAGGGTHMLRFERTGDRIYLVRRNPRFRADSGSAMETSLEDNVGHSVVGAFDIESRHDSTGHLLIDVTDFLVSDYASVGESLGFYYQGPAGPRLDQGRSHVGKVQGFPDNVEIEVQLTFTTDDPPAFGGVGLSDYRSIPVGVRWSFFRLPEDPMEPRIADLRVGHFMTTVQDFSRDESTDPYLRYVHRWRLEKKDPTAELSEPVEPIVFYVDRSVPDRYREHVKAGIEAWNAAFREAGFENAVVAKDPPEDSTWSAEDVRYSTVRWTAAHNMGYAIGPSQVDPRTGEILNADILIAANWVRFWLSEYQELVADPAGASGASGGLPAGGSGLGSARAGGPVGGAGGLAVLSPAHDPLVRALRRADPRMARRLCFAGAARARQVALQYAVLAARGALEPGEKMPEDYLAGAIEDLVMHEVGHTLGLRHNFKATAAIPNDRLHDESYTSEHGVSLSVMDYVPVNLALDPERQGQYWNRSVGTYDDWAIRYAYAPVYRSGGEPTLEPAGEPVADAAAERPALAELAATSAERLHTFATDEDVWLGVDPLVNAYDLGSDPLAYAETRHALIDRVMPRLGERLVAEGQPWHRLRQGYNALFFEKISVVFPATKAIGGLHTSRDYRGQPGARPPFRTVSAERQREALDLIVREVLAEDAFSFDPARLNRLAPNMWSDWSRSASALQNPAYPVHQQVEAVQEAVLSTLLSPDRLARVADNRMRTTDGEEVLGLPGIFSALTSAVWSELERPADPRPVNSFRRNLQRSHVAELQRLLLHDEIRTFGGTVRVPGDARSLARRHLVEVRSRVDGALDAEASLGEESRAHLMEIGARIDRALEASVTLPTEGGGI